MSFVDLNVSLNHSFILTPVNCVNRRSSECFYIIPFIHFLLGSNAVYALVWHSIVFVLLLLWYVGVRGIHWCWHSTPLFFQSFFFALFTICVKHIDSAFSFFTFTFEFEIVFFSLLMKYFLFFLVFFFFTSTPSFLIFRWNNVLRMVPLASWNINSCLKKWNETLGSPFTLNTNKKVCESLWCFYLIHCLCLAMCCCCAFLCSSYLELLAFNCGKEYYGNVVYFNYQCMWLHPSE